MKLKDLLNEIDFLGTHKLSLKIQDVIDAFPPIVKSNIQGKSLKSGYYVFTKDGSMYYYPTARKKVEADHNDVLVNTLLFESNTNWILSYHIPPVKSKTMEMQFTSTGRVTSYGTEFNKKRDKIYKFLVDKGYRK